MTISKLKSTTIALVLMLTVSATLVAFLPIVNSADVDAYAFISVRPNPIGVGQTLFVIETGESALIDSYDTGTEQITHKMVSRACKGRRLTSNTKTKIRNAINKATDKNAHARVCLESAIRLLLFIDFPVWYLI